MPDEKKVVEVTILKNVFSVVADDEIYVQKVVDFVSDTLGEISRKNVHANPIRIAILGCMNVTEMLFESEQKLELAEKAKEKESDKTEAAQTSCFEAQKEIEQQHIEIQSLQDEITTMKQTLIEKEELLNQYRKQLKQAKIESESNRKSILNLQNQLFESQVELNKLKE